MTYQLKHLDKILTKSTDSVLLSLVHTSDGDGSGDGD